ncbi:MAG: glycogen synthase GlgA [Acidobacteriota bacterium]
MAKILMVASEVAPFVKTGGLADVMGSLPAALARAGETVTVLMPRYRGVGGADFRRVREDLPVWLNGFRHRVNIDGCDREGVAYRFVDAPWFYDREGVYSGGGKDWGDNHIRYAILCLAALEMAREIETPDVFHVHDWQGALLPVYQRSWFAGEARLQQVKTLLTIHNLGYQGRFGAAAMGELGLDQKLFHPGALEYFGDVNLLKGGLVMSDWLTTVSPRYAQEIQTAEYGFGLEGLLRERAGSLTGILNGVDYREWDPATDHYLPANYTPEDLRGKRECKRYLVEYFGLPPEAMERPLLGIVSRFAEQKGFDLIEQIAGALADEPMSLVVLGSGNPHWEQMFRNLTNWRPDKFANWIGFSNEMAHRIEAGADIFLMPSRYEPCGLNQIYSLKYGTPPVVRATGGLDDTIDGETGFKFWEYHPEALLKGVRYAIVRWYDRDGWQERMRRGMAKDFSWDRSAGDYQRLYRQLLEG